MLVTANNAPPKNGHVSLSAVVRAKEDKESFWKETTELITVSRSGAGFYLKRKCEVGRLISLMLAIPKHLRCYDTEKELYRVWGLVQYCSPVSGHEDSAYQIGVAFTGKNAPHSYHENPLQSYRVAGLNPDGTWRIIAAKRDFIKRRDMRYSASLDILLSARDWKKNLTVDEAARLVNISSRGAAVLSTLKVEVCDSVNFNCIQHNFSALAIVRNRQEFEHQAPRLHLEFVDAEFPVDKLLPTQAKAEAMGVPMHDDEFFYH